MRDWLGPRFGVEVAAILAVAAALLLLEASWPAVLASIFSTWLVIAAFELALSRRRAGTAAAPLATPAAEPLEADVLEDRPAVEAPAMARDSGEGGEPEELPPAPPPPVLVPVRPVPEEPAADGAAREPEAAAEPEPEPEPTPTTVVELRPHAPREWNLWELERLARERGGEDTTRDEERAYLFMYLREFASPDGSLPLDFDGLVRESFGDLLTVHR